MNVSNRALREPMSKEGKLLRTALPFLDLSQRNKRIVALWLTENVTMKDLGKRHGIGAERVRQILARAQRYSQHWRDGYRTGVTLPHKPQGEPR